jgi:Mce-associated membrane protein
MSNQKPSTVRKRRPIAGERQTGRPGAPGSPSTSLKDRTGTDEPARGWSLFRRAGGSGEPGAGSKPRSPRPEARTPKPDRADDPSGSGRTVPTRILAGLAAVAVLLVATAAWLGLGTWDVRTVQSADAAETASQAAPAAAERAAATILSYNYKSLGGDEAAAERTMTPAYKKKYGQTFDKLVKPNAAKLQARVSADVKSSGVTNADPDRVDVLMFVNQTTTSTANGGQPQVALNRVTFHMVKQKDTWLVDNITSY